MAHIEYKQNKNGLLIAKVRARGTDISTGEKKQFVKYIKNDLNLTPAKFRKFVERESMNFEIDIETKVFQNEQKECIQTKIESKATEAISNQILTFYELAQEYLTHIKKNLSLNYYVRMKQDVEQFNLFLSKRHLADRPISEITVRDIQLFLNSFDTYIVGGKTRAKLKNPLPEKVNFKELDKKAILDYSSSYRMNKHGAPISKNAATKICTKYKLEYEDYFEDYTEIKHYSIEHIKGKRRCLRTIFYEAVRYDWILKNPVCKTKIGSGQQNTSITPVKEKEIFSMEEVKKFLNVLNLTDYSEMHKSIPFKIMLLCGLRTEEVAALRWTDIDFDNKVINVSKARCYTGTMGTYEKGPKSKSSNRKVPMPDSLIDDLKKYYEWFKESVINFENNLSETYVAVNHKREPMCPSSYKKWLNEYETKAGLKHVTPHGLRHTYCSILLSQNVPIQTVSKYLGHSDSTITLEVYSHFIPETKDLVQDALNKICSMV